MSSKKKDNEENERLGSSIGAKSESTPHKFWPKLEALSGVELPVYIKNILHLNSFDNYLAFCSLNLEMLSELEIFVKEDMQDLIEEDCNLQNYFGIYHKNPKKFRFLMGDKALLIRLAALVNNKLDLDYWNPPPPPPPPAQAPPQPAKKLEYRNQSKIKLSDTDNKMEETKLAQMIQNSLHSLAQKYCNNELVQRFATISTGELDIQVTVKEINGDYETSDSFNYNAKLKCVLCSSVITMAKQMRGWIVSNYVRHLQTHLLSPDEKKQSKRRKLSRNALTNTSYSWDDDDDGDGDDSLSYNEQVDDPLQNLNDTKSTSSNKQTKNNSSPVEDATNIKQLINWPTTQYKQLQC